MDSTAGLNHVELVYRPGERAVARKVFELLGATVFDSGGPYMVAKFRPDQTNLLEKVLYASEVTEEQWGFEQRLAAELDGDTDLKAAAAPHLERLIREPQRSFHFGLHVTERDRYEEMIEAVTKAGASDPDLAGRIEVSAVFRPGEPGSITDTMVQTFIRTDVMASGLLTLGQYIELQYHLV
jgi:hypothetical protein